MKRRLRVARITQYVVIGTHPEVDTSVTIGPFRSHTAAYEADEAMAALGYVTETRPLERLSDLASLLDEERA